MSQSGNIRKLPVNSHGKDYVVGDLHGCLDLLLRLLDEVEFDRSRDRLFSVGDLIDRGPDSLACLYLLAEPWFYAVQGNHENMMLDYFRPYLLLNWIGNLHDRSQTQFLWDGGDWVRDYFVSGQHRMTPEFEYGLLLAANLPLIWVVGEGKTRFHVIHAELARPEVNDSGDWVCLNSDIDRWLEHENVPLAMEECLCWSRSIMTMAEFQPLAAIQPGLSVTFCGHTPDVKPRQVLSHVCLDTGAFLSTGLYQIQGDDDHGLTLFDIKESRWVSVSYKRDTLVWGELPLTDSNSTIIQYPS